MHKTGNHNRRLALLDSLRGITLISMILYHACWDVVYIIGADWPWYRSRGGFIWQQSICWTFILLSGFCIPFSRRLLRRGLIVFGAGALVMLVTNLVLPEDRVIFGVLTLIGSCMLLMALVRALTGNRTDMTVGPASERSGQDYREANHEEGSGIFSAEIKLLIFAALFVFLRDINSGVIGTGLLHRVIPVIPNISVALPEFLYSNLFTAYLGFPPLDFYSTDYFSLIPWTFLYLCGYELHHIARKKGILELPIMKKEIKPLSFMGRNSLTIYLLHQPVLYGLVLLYSAIRH